MNLRRTSRRPTSLAMAVSLLLAAGVAAAFLVACSVSQTLAYPQCVGGGSWIIVAQSVPTASKVPCFEPLPTGWDIDSVKVKETGTTIVLSSDRAGTVAATFHYSETCEIGEAVSTPTDHEETERFEHIHELSPAFRADRYYLFEGGCLRWQFEFDVGAPSALSIELGNSMQLHTRAELETVLSEVFLDEDL